MDQEVPASAGRASDRKSVGEGKGVVLVAVTVIQKASPAETEALSADLATSMAAPRTSTEAEAVSDPSLVVVTLAVLSTGEELAVAAVVGDLMCTVSEYAPGKCVELRRRVFPAMAQVV